MFESAPQLMRDRDCFHEKWREAERLCGIACEERERLEAEKKAKGRALSAARLGLREAIECFEAEGIQVAADEAQRALDRSIRLEEDIGLPSSPKQAA